jgi:GntR family transcriptional regulator
MKGWPPLSSFGGVRVDPKSRVPVYRQLYLILREQIDSGQIPAGQPIPSKRTLVQEHQIAANSVQHAIDLLKADGVLETEPGKGLYVLPEDERPAG